MNNNELASNDEVKVLFSVLNAQDLEISILNSGGIKFSKRGKVIIMPANEVYDRLSSQSPAPSEVKDWVMVPRVPTPKMIDATFNDVEERHDFIESHNKRNKRIYSAMLSAAPAQPEQAGRVAELEADKASLLDALKLPIKCWELVSADGYDKADEFLMSKGWDGRCSWNDFYEEYNKKIIVEMESK